MFLLKPKMYIKICIDNTMCYLYESSSLNVQMNFLKKLFNINESATRN